MLAKVLRVTVFKRLCIIAILALAVSTGYPPTRVLSAATLPRYIDEYNVPTIGAAPLAITVDHAGLVWVTESNASKLAIFNPANATFTEYSVPGVGDMWGVVSDLEGRIWMTQYAGRGSVKPGGAIVPGGNGLLLVFDPKSKGFSAVNIPTIGSFPMRITIDTHDRVWFTEFLGNKIGMYDQSDNRLTGYPIPTNTSGPADLTFDRNGALWFTEAYALKVGEFFPDNQSFKEYQLGSETPSMVVSSPVGIAVDARGGIWVADHGGNWIIEFNPSTGKTHKYPPHTPPADIYPVSIPNDLLIDRQGKVWFTEHGGNSVAYFDPDSNVMVEFKIPTGPISVALWMALAPNGDVWFAEWSANKIGVVHASQHVPIFVQSPERQLGVAAGGGTTLSIITNTYQDISGNGTLRYSFTSYNPNDLTVTFSPAYMSLAGLAKVPASAQVEISPNTSPGNYTLSLGLDAGEVAVWTMVDVQITPQPAATQIPFNQILLAMLVIALVGLCGLAFIVRRRS